MLEDSEQIAQRSLVSKVPIFPVLIAKLGWLSTIIINEYLHLLKYLLRK